MKTSLSNPMLAKAWVHFDGSGTVAILDSFNVSSITDSGTGHYVVNLTVAMSNANYAAGGSGGATTGVNDCIEQVTDFNTSNFTWRARNGGGGSIDPNHCNAFVFGDQ